MIYRICSFCGNKWNVSRIDPGEKKYVCPTCDLRRKIKGQKRGVNK